MLKQLTVPALLGVTALVITFIVAPDMGILPRLGLTVAAYLASASILPLIGRNPLRAPLATWGMVVRAFRDRGRADRNGDERGLHQRAAGGDQDRARR